MKFEDTGFADTPLMRRAFQISHDDMHDRPATELSKTTGFADVDSAYESLVITVANNLGLDGDHITDEVIAAAILMGAYANNPRIVLECDPKVREIIEDFSPKYAQMIHIVQVLRDMNMGTLACDADDLDRLVDEIGELQPHQASMVKAVCLNMIKKAQAKVALGTKDDVIQAYIITDQVAQNLYIVLCKALERQNIILDEQPTNLDRLFRTEAHKTSEEITKAALRLGIITSEDTEDHDGGPSGGSAPS